MDSFEVFAHELTELALATHRNVINHEGNMMLPKPDMFKIAQAMLYLRMELEPGDQQSASKKVIFTVLDRLEVMPLNRDSERMIFWMMTDIMERIFPSAGLHF